MGSKCVHFKGVSQEFVLLRMCMFPASGWDSDNLEDFSHWAKEIWSMPPNSTLREIVLSLKTFSAQLATLFEPLQMDEEGFDDSDNASLNDEDPDFEEREPGTGTIHVKTRSRQVPAAKSSAIPDSETPVIMNPKVCKIVSLNPFASGHSNHCP